MIKKVNEYLGMKVLEVKEAVNIVEAMLVTLGDLYKTLSQIEVNNSDIDNFRRVVESICKCEFLCKGYLLEAQILNFKKAANIRVAVDEGLKRVLKMYVEVVGKAGDIINDYEK